MGQFSLMKNPGSTLEQRRENKMTKLSEEYLATMRIRSEKYFIENTTSSDLWHLLAGLLNYPIIIRTGVYAASAGFVIDNEDDLKAFVYALLHNEEE